jgi:CheY-like chemotaxis protein
VAYERARGLAQVKVLVIDDDPVSLALGQAALERHGHTVVTLERALGATAVILRERPDVLLLDLDMPGLSGDAWLHMLRERRILGGDEQLAVILHSGADPAELEKIARETGALGGISKQGSALAFVREFERLVATLPG